MKQLLKAANKIKYTQTLELGTPDGQRVFQKSRRWFAGLVIAGTNVIFALIGEKVRIYTTARWKKHAIARYKELYGLTPEIPSTKPRTLYLPALPGRPLSILLASQPNNPNIPAALRAATQALLDLHKQGIYHGDTTLNNVLFDPATGNTQWIDFEMHYPGGTAPELARTLDWRTWCFSVGNMLSEADFEAFLPSVVEVITAQELAPRLTAILPKRSLYLGLQLTLSRKGRKGIEKQIQAAFSG